MSRKVVVTGLNFINSLGLSYKTSWVKMLQGESGIDKITLFDASSCQTQIAGELSKEFEEYSKSKIKKRAFDQMTRVTRMAFVCAKDAIEESEIDFNDMDKSKCGVILGVVSTGNTSSEKGTTNQNRVLKSMNNAMSAWISLEYKLTGPNFTVA